MTKLSLEGQKWQLESGVCLDTREVFARLAAAEIEKSELCWSEEAPERQPISIRFPLIGPYGVLKLIGEGAFGRVYIAFDARYKTSVQKGKLVALKAPTEALLMRYAEAAQRIEDEEKAKDWAKLNIGELFSKEAVLTASLSTCSSVVSVLDHSISHPYLALEYCNGGSLTKRLNRSYNGETIYQWAYQISHALNEAHSLQPKSLIHRDLKPDNILVHENKLKVSDFGTSELVSRTQSLQSLHSGYTPAYAAPEALDGKAYPATDIWSLGVILYQVTCSHLPFQANNILQLSKKITQDQQVPLTSRPGIGIKDEVYPFIESCLEKDPQNRPTAKECQDLFSQLSGLGIDPREKELEEEKAALQAEKERIELENQKQAQERAVQAKKRDEESQRLKQEYIKKQGELEAQEAELKAKEERIEVERQGEEKKRQFQEKIREKAEKKRQEAESRRLEKEYQEKFRQATEEHKISLSPNWKKAQKEYLCPLVYSSHHRPDSRIFSLARAKTKREHTRKTS